MLAQVRIEVARVAARLPVHSHGGISNRLIFAREFDLRQDKPAIVAVEIRPPPSAYHAIFNDGEASLFDRAGEEQGSSSC